MRRYNMQKYVRFDREREESHTNQRTQPTERRRLVVV